MKKNNGFTLIEILVVTTIIVLLTAGAIVSYSTFLKQSRDAKRKADLGQISAALEMLRSNIDSYTAFSGDCASYTALTEAPKYIESMPADPKSSSDYFYTCIITADDYSLGAFLETGSGTGTCSNCKTGIPCNYCVGPYGQKYP